MSPTRRYRVSGDVQGVGFRAFVVRQARALALDGWVRNRYDGTVEVLASGNQQAHHELRAALAEGPHMSRVDLVDVAEEDRGDVLPRGFGVRPTV
jgi:acylphosphatase